MNLRTLSNDTRISTKVYGGFAAVLLLLVGLAVMSFTNLTATRDRGNEQARLSSNAQAVRSVEAAMTQQRLQAVYYTYTGNAENAERVHAFGSKATQQLGELLGNLQSAASLQKASAIKDLEERYLADFERIVELRSKRDDLVKSRLEIIGSESTDNLAQLSDQATKARLFEIAAQTGRAGHHLMQARLYALRYLAMPNPGFLDNSRAESALFNDAMKAIETEGLGGEAAALVAKAEKLGRDYVETFAQVTEATAAYQKLLNESLRPAGEAMSQAADDLVDDMTTRLNKLTASNEAANASAERLNAILSLCTVVFGLFLAWVIARSITHRLVAMTRAMTNLAAGDSAIAVPALGCKDEIGAMASALEVFRQSALSREQLEAEQRNERQAKERRQKAVDRLIEDFSSTMAGCLGSVGNASKQMLSTANRVSAAASDTKGQVCEANEAAGISNSAVEAVAAAAEELSASISEISNQVVRTASEAADAASESRASKERMDELVANSQKIGQIVDLITGIAAQTNLLALNATIEAARAGDAGKGFAVVAGEVKTLANQTATATQEIAQQVGTIQDATNDAARVIDTVASRVETISTIAAAVAAAVEQQGAATREIAERTQQVAASTAQVTSSVTAVQGAAETSTLAADEVSTAAELVSSQATELQQEIEHFLGAVRSSEERRRFERVSSDIPVHVRLGGQSINDRITDISASGARLEQRHRVNRGDTIELDIPGLGVVRARVADVTKVGTHLQFPMDAAHLQRVEAFIAPMRKAA